MFRMDWAAAAAAAATTTTIMKCRRYRKRL
jgi:hypothetical protein